MKEAAALFLIIISFNLIETTKNQWNYTNLSGPNRLDIYSSSGVITNDTFLTIKRDNPDWDITGAVETSGILKSDQEISVKQLAVTNNYLKLNSLKIIRGHFNVNNAILINKDLAYSLFKTYDITGNYLYLNNDLYLISGVFSSASILNKLNIKTPDIITSLKNIDKSINILQISAPLGTDLNTIKDSIYINEMDKLKLNQRFKLLAQYKDIMYIPFVILILLQLYSIQKNMFKEKIKMYKNLLKKYYVFKSLKKALLYKPYLLICPLLLTIILLSFSRFDLFIPAEYITNISVQKILLSPIQFILSTESSIIPAVILPKVYESISFSILLILFIPGFILLINSTRHKLRYTIYLPLINILYCLIISFIGLEVIFIFKLNLLLTIYMFLRVYMDYSKGFDRKNFK